MNARIGSIERKTRETDISVRICLDGTGIYDVQTGIGFFDHILQGFARHGFFDLKIAANGDLEVDGHHTVEDTGIVLGQAIAAALGTKEGIRRFGHFLLPHGRCAGIMRRGSVRKALSEFRLRVPCGENRRSGHPADPGIFLCPVLVGGNESPYQGIGRDQQPSRSGSDVQSVRKGFGSGSFR